MRFRRAAMLVAGALLVGTAVSGCSGVNSFLHDTFPDHFGPERGADGQVVGPVTVHSYYLESGDCFGFPDAKVRNQVEIVPCSMSHDFTAIGQGVIPLEEQLTMGLQLAISARCAEPFEAFRAAAPPGTRPDQEFLVSEQKEGDRTVTEYVCAAALMKLSE